MSASLPGAVVTNPSNRRGGSRCGVDQSGRQVRQEAGVDNQQLPYVPFGPVDRLFLQPPHVLRLQIPGWIIHWGELVLLILFQNSLLFADSFHSF